MLTAAALLLSENSALSTTLMYHTMLQSEKYHCLLSKRNNDCMSCMVPPGVWVWLYNSYFFLWYALFGCGIGGSSLCICIYGCIYHIITYNVIFMVHFSLLSCMDRVLSLWLSRWGISYHSLFVLTNQPNWILNHWLCTYSSCCPVSCHQNVRRGRML